MSKHTPGPWAAYNLVGNRILQAWRVRSEANHADAGSICRLDESRTGDQQVANAHLIAAAPKLLEALESLLRAPSLGSNGPGSVTIEVQTYNLNAARDAIAKATGKHVAIS